MNRRQILLVALSAVFVTGAFAASLPLAPRPEEVGISSQRLDRVRRQIKADVESKKIPGAVLLIARNGKIASFDAIGYQERKSETPMKKDSIFRIASMSKPITSVAIMILSEEGKLDIGAPVAQYLPEFKEVRVGIEKAAPKRAMTVQDLLRHTSGLTYGLFGTSPVDQLYMKANLFAAKSLGEMVAGIARAAAAAPARRGVGYSMSTDVLGRIVEVRTPAQIHKKGLESHLLQLRHLVMDVGRAGSETSISSPLRSEDKHDQHH